MSEDQLIEDYKSCVYSLSYYYAAEGDSYWREAPQREACLKRFYVLKQQMVEKYGKEFTLQTTNSEPHLLYSEISDLK